MSGDASTSPKAAPVNPDPRVDAYIAAAAPFAQPILRQLRASVLKACP